MGIGRVLAADLTSCSVALREPWRRVSLPLSGVALSSTSELIRADRSSAALLSSLAACFRRLV